MTTASNPPPTKSPITDEDLIEIAMQLSYLDIVRLLHVGMQLRVQIGKGDTTVLELAKMIPTVIERFEQHRVN